MNGFIKERILKKGLSANGKAKLNTKVYDVFYKYKEDSGKWKSGSKKGFRKKAEAESFLVEIQHQINSNRYIPNKKILVKEFLQDWFKTDIELNVRPNTADGYNVNIEKHIIPNIGDKPLQELTAVQIQGFYNSLHEKYKKNEPGGLSPKSILYVHRVLSKALDSAVRKNLIPRNVSKDVTRPKVPKYQSEIYTANELLTLIEKVYDTDWEVPVILAGLCGMRRAEVLGLKWSDINYSEKTIAIQRNVICSSKRFELSETTKTQSSTRTIAISEEIINALKRLWKRQERYKLVFKEEYIDDNLVNCNQDGSIMMPNNLSRDFKRLLKKLNMKHIRFHDLRHSAASLMLVSDVPMKVISDILGHSSLSITADLYTHVMDASKMDAADKISNAIFCKVKESTHRYNESA